MRRRRTISLAHPDGARSDAETHLGILGTGDVYTFVSGQFEEQTAHLEAVQWARLGEASGICSLDLEGSRCTRRTLRLDPARRIRDDVGLLALVADGELDNDRVEQPLSLGTGHITPIAAAGQHSETVSDTGPDHTVHLYRDELEDTDAGSECRNFMPEDELSRVAVVTGGASGLGLSICEHLARHGHRVAVLDRDGDAAEAGSRTAPRSRGAQRRRRRGRRGRPGLGRAGVRDGALRARTRRDPGDQRRRSPGSCRSRRSRSTSGTRTHRA